MMQTKLDQIIKKYPDFPKAGIVFRDLLPILENPKVFHDLVDEMSSSNLFKDSEAIISIDARGFIFGSAISMKLNKPMLVARKPGKLPGELIKKTYELEYGTNSLSIQKNALERYCSFVIVDDLLATGGTAKCVAQILSENKKEILGLSVVVELQDLKGKENFNYPVDSVIKY